MATSDEPELAGPAASTEHGRPGDDLWPLERGMLRKPLKGLAQPCLALSGFYCCCWHDGGRMAVGTDGAKRC